MADLKIQTRPSWGQGTRVSVRLDFDTWSAPSPAQLIADITTAVALLVGEGIPSDQTKTDVDLECNDRDGHELKVEIYGYRPNTPAERAKMTRERKAAAKKQAEWHRAQLARLEDS